MVTDASDEQPLKAPSPIVVTDDGIDTDEGFQGKLQFVFVMLGANGDKGMEMEGGDA